MANIQVITQTLIQELYGDGVQSVPTGDLIQSQQLPHAQPGYQAWLGYRSGHGLMVETPQRRSDGKYWHRLAVGEEVVVHWSAAKAKDQGEVYAFYAPHPQILGTRYQINGDYFGNGHAMSGTMDRWLKTIDVEQMYAQAGHALKITALPARFAIVVEWRHYNEIDPTLPQPVEKTTYRGMGGEQKGMGGADSTYLGEQSAQQGTAKHRKIVQVLYVEAFAMHPSVR